MNFNNAASGSHVTRPRAVLRRDPDLRPAMPTRASPRNSLVTGRATRGPRHPFYKRTTEKVHLPTIPQQPTSTAQHLFLSLCPICQESIHRDSMNAVKCCGYVFCEKCINECIDRFGQCPMCRTNILKKDLTTLKFYIDTTGFW